jgi:hypothetical protein
MSFEGRWDLTVTSPMGTKVFRLDLRTEGGALQGTASTGGETTPMVDPAVQDGHLRWAMRLPRPMNAVLEVEVVRDGDTLSGSAKAGHMVLPGVRGVKVP